MNIEMLENDTDQATMALTVQERASVALGSSQTRQNLLTLVAKSAHLVEVKNKAARDEIHSAAMVLVNARTTISKTGKAARDDATKFSKAVISEEASLISLTEPEEKRLLALRDAWDDAIAAEKATKEAAERQRITAIHERISEMLGHHALSLQCRTSDAVMRLVDRLTEFDMTGFEEFEAEAAALHTQTMEAMLKVVELKKADEAEQARIKAEQAATAAQLAAARVELELAKAEQDRINKANRDAAIEEADRLATERQKLADEAAAKQKSAQAELDRQREEIAAQRAALEALMAAQVVEAEEVPALEEQASAAIEMEASTPVLSEKADADRNASEFINRIDALQFTQPSAEALIAVIASHFEITSDTAAQWLDSADFTPYY